MSGLDRVIELWLTGRAKGAGRGRRKKKAKATVAAVVCGGGRMLQIPVGVFHDHE